MKVALLFPPQWYPSQPYLALPTLKAHLESKGHEVDQFDLNIECYDVFLSKEYLERCVEIIRRRLADPTRSTEDQEVRPIYKDILSDVGFLESVLNEVEDAKNVLRDENRFFQFEIYSQAYTNLKIAMQLISYTHHPSRLDLDSFFMQGNPEEHLSGIMNATEDTVRNPFLLMFEQYLAPKIPWGDYGIVGLSISHIGQVIPGLTLARQLRRCYPHLHIVVGGSVFNRHADLLDDKQQLFKEFFHSLIVSEGELPLDHLVSHLKANKPLQTVPNLIYLEGDKVIRNPKTEALPYEEMVCPTFDQLPLEKYLMPYPVLPYMSSRGCYWGKCTFCTHSFIYDSHYRKENEVRVAEELDHLSKKYKTKYFTFSDEAISPNAFNRMSKEILKRGVEIRSLGMLKFESGEKESPELFDDVYRAGFLMLFFGLESANDRILSVIDKGCDQETERTVLRHSSEAGIWNHLYLFFGFPTEERAEAEDTIRFTKENSEVKSGIIHSVGQSIFALEKDSAIYHNPAKFKIDRIIHNPERDMAIVFDFEIKSGMPRDEVMDVYESFDSVIEEHFPSRKIWNYLSREHFLLYLDHYGKEEILNMATTDVAP
ncbi:MAG: radical SAM protein [Nitrospinota bacterium]|nr:radical SAM protein [Nitrospinota bacterium]